MVIFSLSVSNELHKRVGNDRILSVEMFMPNFQLNNRHENHKDK